MINTQIYGEITGGQATVKLFGQQLHVFVYLLDGLLIDTGPSRRAEELVSFYQSMRIEQVVLTHNHEDHTGLAPWLQKELGVPVRIHETGIAPCREKADIPFYRRMFWGDREPFDPQALSAQVETERYRFEVLHTPGHAPDHVVLYNRENGWLFTGDLYLHARPKMIMRHESIPQIMESLRKLVSLDVSTVFCCHAGIVENGREMLLAKLQHLEEVRGEVLQMREKGYSIREICSRLYPQRYPLTYLSLFEFSPEHIVRSILENR
jgi:ribonuclease/clavin/mitogillin